MTVRKSAPDIQRKHAHRSIAELTGDAFLSGDGEQVWIEVIRKMDEVYNDLLEYEVALETKNAALEESQQFIVSVLATMSDILLVCTRSGAIEEVNQALLDFTGKSEAELQGTAVFALFADEASREQAKVFFTQHAGESLHDHELQLRAVNGAAIPVSLNFKPRFSSAGKLVGVVITGRPVGELRRAYHALRQAHDDLKRTQQQLLHSEKMSSLGRLVAGVAHELNNPISFVLGNVHAMRRYVRRLHQYIEEVHAGASTAELQLLREGLRIDRILEDMPLLLEGTIEGAERTRDIVDGLKRFSAADRDENLEFNLVDVIERAVHWVTKATLPRFQVKLDLPKHLPILGSAGQMQQVIMNLVQNAHDATLGSTSPHLEIKARTEESDQRLVVEFLDNGTGIALDDLPKIFDPFYTTKSIGKGTGLGLAISYGIVERHGGSLSVANRPEGGTVFAISLPRIRASA
ncbi:MAG: PAS domain S-box protein [Betaproteobacteria bacterium]|nr:PAS domain S-box protein [Betaproteobacteria bacterium]